MFKINGNDIDIYVVIRGSYGNDIILRNYTKDEVKQIAIENNLGTEQTKESYDICFLGSEKFKDFMNKNYPEKPGKIIDVKTNKVVGEHTGISKYTIGKRRGLNIGGINGFEANRWFVVEKDIKTNKLAS